MIPFMQIIFNDCDMKLIKGTSLRFIYITVKAKATSLLTCCIISSLCIYSDSSSDKGQRKKSLSHSL